VCCVTVPETHAVMNSRENLNQSCVYDSARLFAGHCDFCEERGGHVVLTEFVSFSFISRRRVSNAVICQPEIISQRTASVVCRAGRK
jgi:hypothetical protein